MSPIIIQPKDRQHWLDLKKQDISSTEISGLFGESKIHTYYSLFFQKKGNLPTPDLEDVERVFWGTELEAAIASGVAKKLKLKIEKVSEYMRHGEVSRMGSSFDYRIIGVEDDAPDLIKKMFSEKGRGNLEIKNVDGLIYFNDWLEDKAPIHIETQVQQQMEVSDIDWTLIVALVGGNELNYIIRERDYFKGQEIIEKINAFWYNFDQGIEPEPDFERDAKNAIKLHQKVNHDLPIFDATKANNISYRMNYLVRKYRKLSDLRTRIDDLAQVHRAEILCILGEFPKAKTHDFNITTNFIEATSYQVTKEAYRSMKVTPIKIKKTEAKK